MAGNSERRAASWQAVISLLKIVVWLGVALFLAYIAVTLVESYA